MKKLQIWLLTDLKSGSDEMFAKAVRHAQYLEANLNVIHVKSPIEIVTVANQLSAKKKLHEYRLTSLKHIEALTESLGLSDFPLNFEVIYGNLKSCIQERIGEEQPDIILLGSRTSKSILRKDSFTTWMKKRYDNAVVVFENGHFQLTEVMVS